MKKIALFLVLLIFSAGCVTVQDYNKLQNDVKQLYKIEESRHNQVEKRLNRLEASLSDLHNKTESIISQQTDSVRSTQANLWSQIESQRVEIARLKGRQELLNKKLKKIEKTNTNNTERLEKVNQTVKGLNDNQQMLISQLGVDIEQQSVQDSNNRNKATGTEKVSKKTPDKLYEEALQAFKSKKYDQALAIWTEFLNSFSDHELVPNAYFWKGECHYQLKEYGQAILQYQTVIEEFPKSSKLPAAILKQGLCFYKRGKNKAGRIILQKLIDKHPKTAEAKRAKIFLKNK